MKRLLLLYSLFYGCFAQAQPLKPFTFSHGAIIRGDSTKKNLALVFTADEYGEGLPKIISTLKEQNVKAAFFFTGRFYRNKNVQQSIKKLNTDGHYLGPHSDEHLLYCNWQKRDSLLVTKDSFGKDLLQNEDLMVKQKLCFNKPTFFIPPFEWWNDSIAAWSHQLNFSLFSFTPELRTAADYTWPEMGAAYKSSQWILNQLQERIAIYPSVLNGSIILVHAGTDPRRKDKFYNRLKEMISAIRKAGYRFVRIDQLLSP